MSFEVARTRRCALHAVSWHEEAVSRTIHHRARSSSPSLSITNCIALFFFCSRVPQTSIVVKRGSSLARAPQTEPEPEAAYGLGFCRTRVLNRSIGIARRGIEPCFRRAGTFVPACSLRVFSAPPRQPRSRGDCSEPASRAIFLSLRTIHGIPRPVRMQSTEKM